MVQRVCVRGRGGWAVVLLISCSGAELKSSNLWFSFTVACQLPQDADLATEHLEAVGEF